MKRRIAALCFFVLLLAACGRDNARETAENCIENEPERVAGLQVEGARSERNVIHNLWPVVCKAQELYRERLAEHPGLKGTIELSMVVEFNGEIGAFSIARSTMDDKDFEKQVIRLLQFMDFDSYGAHNSEAEIRYPIHFKP
jgi:TonB family protein